MATKKNVSGTSKRRYSKGEEVHKEMHKFKQGTAHSGKGYAPVKSRAQAVAIGLSEARKKGEKVPKKSTRKNSSASDMLTSGRSKSSRSSGTSKKATNSSRASGSRSKSAKSSRSSSRR